MTLPKKNTSLTINWLYHIELELLSKVMWDTICMIECTLFIVASSNVMLGTWNVVRKY